jgi:exopolysaccharide biosynthesis protein
VRGLDKDGRVMFLTVDGEFPSKGMTFWEAAELMLEFGCVTAFDGGGGGDSVDVVDGEVVNVPDNKNLDGSLGAERTVPQTILVFTR